MTLYEMRQDTVLITMPTLSYERVNVIIRNSGESRSE